MKILTIVGARPQFVKCAAVSRELRKSATEILVHTGQHYDESMSDIFFRELSIPIPDYNLGVGSGPHGRQTGRMLEQIEEVLLHETPTAVLVYGDTNSTLAGALAACKARIPIAHVEAGLRSFNRSMPEESNRILTDHASDLLLAPTPTAVTNLRNEGLSPSRIHLVGDVMYDAVLFYRRLAEARTDVFSKFSLKPGHFAVATIHRAENTENPERLTTIWKALKSLSAHLPILFPIHPRTRKALTISGLSSEDDESLKVINPIGYLDMIATVSNARLTITDSGGLQKEAYFCGTPCITLRDETEWVESLASGWNRLAPPSDPQRLTARLKTAIEALPTSPRDTSLYGSGHASKKIVRILRDELAKA